MCGVQECTVDWCWPTTTTNTAAGADDDKGPTVQEATSAGRWVSWPGRDEVAEASDGRVGGGEGGDAERSKWRYRLRLAGIPSMFSGTSVRHV